MSEPQTSKRLARLAAVQALYQIDLTGSPAKDIIRDMIAYPAELLEDIDHGGKDSTMDRALFTTIVTGTSQNRDEIDGILTGAVDAKFSLARMEILLRAVLRAGVYELYHQAATASGIIINDYVDVAHAYFNDKEPGLVNAVLDRLSKKLRS